MAESATTYGPPIALSSVNVRPAGNPPYPSCRPCSAVWRHWSARRTMPGRRSTADHGPRSPSRRAQLSSAGFTVDAEDEETVRFHTAIQALAAAISREPNKQRRDICTVSCSTTAMTRWSMSPTWALSSTAGRPPPGDSHLCEGVEFGDHENAPRDVLLSRTRTRRFPGQEIM